MLNPVIAILAKKNNSVFIQMEKKFFIIVHNVRSAYNVGSIFRTADGAGATKIYLTGYTPAPASGNNSNKKPLYLTQAQKMIAKTALGAEKSVLWEKTKNISRLIKKLKKEDTRIVAVEQSERSIDYHKFNPTPAVAIILGNEVRGINQRILDQCDAVIEIPMRGRKKSLNVSVALGIAAYEIGNKIR